MPMGVVGGIVRNKKEKNHTRSMVVHQPLYLPSRRLLLLLLLLLLL
jgi:hypothetical protein